MEETDRESEGDVSGQTERVREMLVEDEGQEEEGKGKRKG